MKNYIIHKANTRGYANHGWLEARHTFSFAGYYDPERIHFGKLRVLNNDIVAGGTGFVHESLLSAELKAAEANFAVAFAREQNLGRRKEIMDLMNINHLSSLNNIIQKIFLKTNTSNLGALACLFSNCGFV